MKSRPVAGRRRCPVRVGWHRPAWSLEPSGTIRCRDVRQSFRMPSDHLVRKCILVTEADVRSAHLYAAFSSLTRMSSAVEMFGAGRRQLPPLGARRHHGSLPGAMTSPSLRRAQPLESRVMVARAAVTPVPTSPAAVADCPSRSAPE